MTSIETQPLPGAGAVAKRELMEDILQNIGSRTCRSCGCSDVDACVVVEAPARAWNQPGQPCWWVEDNLCSACTDRVDPRLIWRHGGEHPGQQAEPLSWRHKATFAWVAFVICCGIAKLAGLIP